MIATINETGCKAFRGNGPIGPHRIVRVVAAGTGRNPPTVDVVLPSSTTWLGTLSQECFNEGDPVTVYMRNKAGTQLVVAAEAFAVGAELYLALGGRVTAEEPEEDPVRCGIAMTYATQLGDYVEMMPEKH